MCVCSDVSCRQGGVEVVGEVEEGEVKEVDAGEKGEACKHLR